MTMVGCSRLGGMQQQQQHGRLQGATSRRRSFHPRSRAQQSTDTLIIHDITQRFIHATRSNFMTMLLSSFVTLLLFCTSTPSFLSPCVGQFASQPISPPCPEGFDCVGQQSQLKNFLAPTRDPISCDTLSANGDPGAFEGYLCTNTSELKLCPSGSFCPTTYTKIECPSGYVCGQGNSQPTECVPGSLCGSGSFKQTVTLPFLLFVILFFSLVTAHCCVKRRRRSRVYAASSSPSPDGVEMTASTKKAHPMRLSHGESMLNLTDASGTAIDGGVPDKLILKIHQVRVEVKEEGGMGHTNAQSNAAVEPDSDSDDDEDSEPSTARQPQPTPEPATTPGMKTILRDVSTTIRAGRLVGIMGPSGSGKTTLLHALLGRVPLSSGSILVNDHYTPQQLAQMGVVSLVPQSDTMLPMMHVRDLITHAAHTRLPKTWSRDQKMLKVERTMQLLGLTHVADSKVGDDHERGVSGGERKRVSIGVELVSNPLLLMLDEPTSGLDSAAALQVCSSLRRIARSNRLVVAVIHQPRYEIFNAFDDLIVLGRGGYVIYNGPVREVGDFCVKVGRPLPKHCNIADHIIDVISEEGFMKKWAEKGLEGVLATATTDSAVVPLPARQLSSPVAHGHGHGNSSIVERRTSKFINQTALQNAAATAGKDGNGNDAAAKSMVRLMSIGTEELPTEAPSSSQPPPRPPSATTTTAAGHEAKPHARLPGATESMTEDDPNVTSTTAGGATGARSNRSTNNTNASKNVLDHGEIKSAISAPLSPANGVQKQSSTSINRPASRGAGVGEREQAWSDAPPGTCTGPQQQPSTSSPGSPLMTPSGKSAATLPGLQPVGTTNGSGSGGAPSLPTRTLTPSGADPSASVSPPSPTPATGTSKVDSSKTHSPAHATTEIVPLTGNNKNDSSLAHHTVDMTSSSTPAPAIPARVAAGFFWQFLFHLYRAFLMDLRSPRLLFFDSMLQILPAVALAFPFMSEDTYAPPLPSVVAETCADMFLEKCRSSVMVPEALFVHPTFYMTMIIGAAAQVFAVNTFGRHMVFFRRERGSGLNLPAYFLAKVMYDLLHVTRSTFIFVAFYFLMNAPRGSLGDWFGLIWCLYFAGFGVAYTISFLVRFDRSTTVSVCAAVCFSITSGLSPRLSEVNDWGPLLFLWWISFNRWGAESMLLLGFGGQISPSAQQRMGEAITATGYDPDNMRLGIGMSFVIGVMWRILAFIAMWKKKS